MFAKWFEEYRRISHKTLFLSQLGTFLISIFTFLSLYDWFQLYLQHPNWIEEFRSGPENLFDTALILQLAILFIFGLRFATLFLKSKKAFKVNIGLYLTGILVLSFYWFISEPVRPKAGVYSTYNELFLYTSKGFNFFGFLYLILSPIRQFITFGLAIIGYK